MAEAGEAAEAGALAAAADDPAEEAQVAAGKQKHSPIVEAIARAENHTRAEIRVHLSERIFEKDALARARQIFTRLGMSQTRERNAVLLYVNLRRRRFAIYGDQAVHDRLGDPVWRKILATLREDLLGTHPERAVAQCVDLIGVVLGQLFPKVPGRDNPNELPDQVSLD